MHRQKQRNTTFTVLLEPLIAVSRIICEMWCRNWIRHKHTCALSAEVIIPVTSWREF